jgi:hypothetical protein
MKDWVQFFATIGGAAATLTGLIFVGISINLNKILSISRLPDRASQALILLVTVLVVSGLCLIPGLNASLLGIEFLVLGTIVWIVNLKLDIGIFHKTSDQYKKRHLLNALLTQFSVLPYIISGIVLLTSGFTGIYWLLPAIFFSFIKSVLDAWVLLVEINR